MQKMPAVVSKVSLRFIKLLTQSITITILLSICINGCGYFDYDATNVE